jgi:hypothetical protein
MLFRRNFRLIAILAMTLSMAVSAGSPAAAQDSPTDLLKYLDGLESAYSRRYMAPDEFALGSLATPEGAAEQGSTWIVYTTVLEFTSADEVSSAYSGMVNDEMARIIMDQPNIEFVVDKSVELGDQAHLYVGPTEHGDDDEVAGLLIVQDDNLGFMVSAAGSDASIEQTLRDFGEFMVDQEPGTGDISVDEFGFASGGTFDVMPTSTDTDVIGNLIPMFDYDLLVSNSPLEGAATPVN